MASQPPLVSQISCFDALPLAFPITLPRGAHQKYRALAKLVYEAGTGLLTPSSLYLRKMNEHQRNTRIKNNSPRLHLQDMVTWVLENTSRIVRTFQGIFQEGD